MKNALLILAILGSFSVHADLPGNVTNCSASIDGDTANKQAEANKQAKMVFADAKPTPAPASSSHGTSVSH
jgi:hypothetical protein